MATLRRVILLRALKLFDLTILFSAFLLARGLAFEGGSTVSFTEFFSMAVKVGNVVIFVGLLILWHTLLFSFGLYESRRLSNRVFEVADVLKATSLGALGVSVAGSIFGIRMATPSFLLVFWILSTAMLVCSRLLLRAILAQIRRRGRNLRNVLIVGTNARAVEFVDKVQAKPDLGYRILGFADQEWVGSDPLPESSHGLVCDLKSLPVFLRENVVDEVVIALPIRSFHEDASRIAVVCEEQGIVFRVLSNLFDLKRARARAEQVDDDWWIAHHVGISEGWPLVMKRVLDFTVALAALSVVWPVLVLAALLIKLTSPGPIFFVQNRVGHNKRKFKIYKFRTMVVDAEARMRELEHRNEVSGPVFKIKHDPRVTPIGRLLRKTSIDELPQLINVLNGDMSLVGPRPLPVRDCQGFSEDWHRRRFSVRPGMTCLWQVSGRSSLSFDKWMELDMQYIDKWSFWLDLKILAQTVPAVLKGTGAA
jgi:exopolysaccharide biosynthesis polyprenyl glycosylphosphotransferase